MSRWTQIDHGLTDMGATWRVGLVAGRLTICVDKVTIRPEDGEKFAEAVAAAWAEAERRIEAHGAPAGACGCPDTTRCGHAEN